MKHGPLFSPCQSLLPSCARLMSVALIGAAGLLAGATPARAQVNPADAEEWSSAVRTIDAPRKIDEFAGQLGHCHLTARLDNLAVHIETAPKLKAYVVVRDPAGGKAGRAAWHLKNIFYYLTQQRGIEGGRVVTVYGGAVAGEEVHTELWVAPEGAEPPARPVAEPPTEGLLDTYATDENTFRKDVEMGWPSYAVYFSDFAARLKQRPDAQGYLVIRAARGSLPGAWRRIARRDEHLLQNGFGVEAGRVKSINGGPADGEKSEVELWLLPRSAPPPAGAPERPGAERLKEASALNAQDFYSGPPDEEATRWVLDNLAELLREEKGATGVIIVREQSLEEESSEEGEEGASAEEPPQAGTTAGGETSGVAQSPESKSAPAANQASQADEADAAQNGEENGEDVEADDVLSVAESWKRTLAEKYGIEPQRVVVLVGHPQSYGWGRLETWVVPAGKPLPDPFVVTKDEEEAEEVETVVEVTPAGAETAREEQPPPARL